MSLADSIGWVATCLMAWGSVWIAHKNICGLWLMLAGNLMFVAVGALTGLTSLAFVSVLMGALDYYGIMQWRKQ